MSPLACRSDSTSGTEPSGMLIDASLIITRGQAIFSGGKFFGQRFLTA
jgi:hypothetical protein